jgi:hypothetical protein
MCLFDADLKTILQQVAAGALTGGGVKIGLDFHLQTYSAIDYKINAGDK